MRASIVIYLALYLSFSPSLFVAKDRAYLFLELHGLYRNVSTLPEENARSVLAEISIPVY